MIRLHLLLIFCSSIVLADPSPAKVHKESNSKCVVETTKGEYPTVTVFIANKPILGPLEWGLSFELFSPSGKYVALSNSEVAWFKDANQHFRIAVVNCETGQVGYYIEAKDVSKPKHSGFITYASIKKWTADETQIEYVDFYNYDQKKSAVLKFDKLNPLP